MGIFSFLKKTETVKESKSYLAKVKFTKQLGLNGKIIAFEIPEELREKFKFIPGQYINVIPKINELKLSRSYSICSGPDESLSIGVKAIENGIVSNYLVNQLKPGDEVELSFPMGSFQLKESMKSVVCFAAGSGITPFMSFAKSLQEDQNMKLFFGNSTKESTFFLQDLQENKKVQTTYFFSKESVENCKSGRLDKQQVSELIKADLSILKSDAFFICGPEEMILAIQEVLTVFGVSKDKIHFELFTTPVLSKGNVTSSGESNFKGISKVSAILDGEIFRVDLANTGKSVLEAFIEAGAGAPYSCKGGVCCTCKAKIIEGSASMDINYSLTDEEVKAGYILTCQSHPTSEVLKIDYDV